MRITNSQAIYDRIITFGKRVFTRRTGRGAALAIVGLGASFLVFGDAVSKPHDFTAGQVISAAEMNENFDTVYAKVNALDAAVGSMASTWAVAGTDVSHTGNVAVSGTLQSGNLLLKGPATIDIPSYSGPGWTIFHNADESTGDYGLTFQRGSDIWLELGFTAFGWDTSVFSKGKVAIGTPRGTDFSVAPGKTTCADSWSTCSSIRFKDNIRPLDNALDKVMQLKGVEFTWKSTKAHSIGFIAEEAGKVVPELVTYEENGKDAIGMDYDKVTVLLVEALKTQEKRIAELEAQLAELSKRQPDW